ncbi:radical SAM protein [Patescibacteria group bacterium]|nr:radical SAM protein [Patescibacteria group bacterium]
MLIENIVHSGKTFKYILARAKRMFETRLRHLAFSIMESIKTIRLGIKILFAKIIKKPIPFQVFIRVLEQCNQRCSYCKGDYPIQSFKPPTTKQLLELIDGLAYLGTKRITLTGGEPLLRDDIHVIIRHIKSHGINASLTTNGRLINKHIKSIRDLDLLSVSIDGDRFCHDAYCGKGSYDAAIHAIKVARNIGVPVQLLCTVTRLTDPKLASLIEIAERYDCSITFDLLNPFFNIDGSMSLRPEDAGEEAINSFFSYQIKHRNPRVVPSLYVLKYIRNWPASYTTFRLFYNQIPPGFKPIKCYAGHFSALIETNGDLMPCCFMRPDYSPTNVFELGVEKAWQYMPKNNCITCRAIGYNMFNALFSFHFGSLSHFLKVMRKIGF